MEDTTAVLETTELEAEEIGTEGSEDSQESSQGESTESIVQNETHDEHAIVEADGGKLRLSEKALDTLNKLKAEDPKQAREFRAALFDAAQLRKEFPEGIREAVSLKQELEEIGGLEAVGVMKGELEAWKGLDSDFQAGSPKFVDDIASDNPDAFTKAAPHVMSKYAELDPDGFSFQVSRVFAQDMAANNIALTMERMKDFILAEDGKTIKPGMEGVARQWQALASYVDRVNGLASNAPKPKEGQRQAGNVSEVEQREQALTVREFSNERSAVKNAITESEFKKNAGTRKIPSDKVSTIQELYESALNRAVQATPKHRETVDRYVAAKDRTGYRKYMDGVIRKAAPGAMSAAFRRAGVGDKPGPRAVPAKKTTTATPAAQAATGFTRVGNSPGNNTVDWAATKTIAGKKAGDGKYILRDGSKVLYQR